MVLGNLVKSFNVSDVSRQEPWQHASLSLLRPEFWSQWVNQSDGKKSLRGSDSVRAVLFFCLTPGDGRCCICVVFETCWSQPRTSASRFRKMGSKIQITLYSMQLHSHSPHHTTLKLSCSNRNVSKN